MLAKINTYIMSRPKTMNLTKQKDRHSIYGVKTERIAPCLYYEIAYRGGSMLHSSSETKSTQHFTDSTILFNAKNNK